MITPLIFSLLAFFIVTTTTIVVIKNKSKVNHIDKSFNVSKIQFEKDSYENQKKLQNLVNEVNLNNKRLENNQEKNKAELKLEDKKTNKRVQNLDNRFNSYKNITTANFIGINNRMTEENKRLKDDIDINRRKTIENKSIMNAMNFKTNERIDATSNNLSSFISNKYEQKMKALNSRNDTQDSNILDIYTVIEEATIETSNLTLDAREVIKNNVIKKDKIVKDSLDNFFNTSDFVTNNYTRSNDEKLFSTWFDNYYRIGSRQNFNTFDELLTKADEDMTTMRTEQIKINSNTFRLDGHDTLLSSSCNLYKNDLHSFIEEKYDFDMAKLTNINNNVSKIDKINEDLITLSNLMKGIAVIDVETGESTMSLQDLNDNIIKNTEGVNSNSELLETKLNTSDFNLKMSDYLPSYYDSISSNLNVSSLVDKLENQDLSLSIIDAREMSTNVLNVNGEDFTTKVNQGESYMNSLKHVFGMDYVEDALAQASATPESPDLITNLDGPLMKFTKTGLLGGRDTNEVGINWNQTSHDDEEKSDRVEFAPGVDIQLSRKTFDTSDVNNTKVGGRIILDSFDDIGLATRHPNGAMRNTLNDYTKRYELSPTLGSSLSDINTRIEEIQKTTQNDGLTKHQLYNTIHNLSGEDKLTTYKTSDNLYSGEFNDRIANSFRIKDLYTGHPSSSCHQNNNSEQCKTVDERLTSLESANTFDSIFDSGFGSKLENYHGVMGNSSSNLLIRNPKVLVKNELSVSNAKLDNATINVLKIPIDGKIVLQEKGDITVEKQVNNVPTYPSLFDTVVDIDSPNYIKDITSTATGFSFIKGDDTESTITFPTSSHTISGSDIKDVSKENDYTYKNGMDSSHTDNFVFSRHDGTSLTSTGIPDIIVPKKYVYNIDDTPTDYVFKSVEANSDNLSTISIPKGMNSRAGVLDKLGENIASTEVIPKFNKIKLGDQGCLTMSDGQLFVCDSSCSSTSCVKVWDRKDAPEPTIMSSST